MIYFAWEVQHKAPSLTQDNGDDPLTTKNHGYFVHNDVKNIYFKNLIIKSHLIKE